MTNNFYLAISWWFQTAWRFMTSIYFPGTNVTPAGMLLFGGCVYIGFKFVHRILFTGPGGDNNEKDN